MTLHGKIFKILFQRIHRDKSTVHLASHLPSVTDFTGLTSYELKPYKRGGVTFSVFDAICLRVFLVVY